MRRRRSPPRRRRAGGEGAGLDRVGRRRRSSAAPATRSTSRGRSRTRLPWEQVEAADWDRDTSTLRVSEVGSWGEPRVEHDARRSRSPAGCWSWSASGSPPASSCSGTSRSPGAAALRVIARRAPAATGRWPGSTSTTRASTPTTRRSGRLADGGAGRGPRRGRPSELSRLRPISRASAALLTCAALHAIPCSSTGRAFGC